MVTWGFLWKLARSTCKVVLKCVLVRMGLNKPLENFLGATGGSVESWWWLGCGLEVLPICR